MSPSLPLRLSASGLALLLAAAAACSKSDDAGGTDTGAAATAAADSARRDTGMAGMDHSKMAGADRPAAKDADHEFLRKMSDHHEGLVVMAGGAMEKASAATAKADARKLHDKQAMERDSMVATIRTAYSETLTPMVMPHNRMMNDSLQALATGRQYDSTFYHHVVMHHREGVAMIDSMMPRLTRAEVKRMAEKMRADQTREIPEFERKMAGR